MILGIGIDSIEIERFKPWANYSKKKLLKVFSEEEIVYSLSIPSKSAERLAARFAAKEATFKALHPLLHGKNIGFAQFCTKVSTINKCPAPTLILDLETIIDTTLELTSFISLTHTKTTATAIIIIEKR